MKKRVILTIFTVIVLFMIMGSGGRYGGDSQKAGGSVAITILTFSATGDGLEQSYIIPSGTKSLAFRASTDVDLRKTTGTGGDKWVIKSSLPESWNDIEQLHGDTLYFTGIQDSTLTIRKFTTGN